MRKTPLAQHAIAKQHELNKIEHKSISKQKSDEEANKKFRLKQEKKKQKHRGH